MAQSGMAGYGTSTKREAMNMWAEGVAFRDIAEKLGVKRHQTVMNWRDKSDPVDWDAHKREVDKAAEAVLVQKLADKHVKAVIGQYENAQLLESAVRTLLRDKITVDESTGKWTLADDLTASELRACQLALEGTQKIQARIFGTPTEIFGTDPNPSPYSDPDEFEAELEGKTPQEIHLLLARELEENNDRP